MHINTSSTKHIELCKTIIGKSEHPGEVSASGHLKRISNAQKIADTLVMPRASSKVNGIQAKMLSGKHCSLDDFKEYH